MSVVLKHAEIYTGDGKIDDGYVRFDRTIEAIGPMSEYVAQAKDQVEFVNGRKLMLDLLTFIPMVAMDLTRWMEILNRLTQWLTRWSMKESPLFFLLP